MVLLHEDALGVDADSGLVHTVTTTAANEDDLEQVAELLHGKEEHVWAHSGYRGAQSCVVCRFRKNANVLVPFHYAKWHGKKAEEA